MSDKNDLSSGLKNDLLQENARLRKENEALRQSYDQYHAMEEKLILFSEAVENAPDGVQIVDMEGYILYSNKAVEKIYGFPREEYKGRHVNEMNVDPELASRVIIPSIKEKGQWTGELMVKHKCGKAFPVWLTTSIVKSNRDEPIAMVGIIKDMTERRRIEDALRQSGERYRNLFENSPISIWEEDNSWIKNYLDDLRNRGVRNVRAYFEEHPQEVVMLASKVKVIDVNRATVEIFKAKDKRELIDGLGKVFTEKSYDVFREELIAIAEGRTEFESEDVVRTLAGDEINVNVRWSVVPGFENTYSKRLVSITDITERKRAEEAIKNYARKLEESNRMKELFMDIMHHDLLNPLSVARGYVELLLEQEKASDKIESLKRVERNLSKGTELIECATMLSRLQNPEDFELKTLDLREVIDKVVENLHPLAAKAGMNIESNIAQSMLIRGDGIIEEVFSNLISNAVKYAYSGKKIQLKSEDRGECWQVRVIDFGRGIANRDKASIFERFKRMEKRGVKGSGLGLTIARKVVELHRGRIWVEDNPDGGAVFIVELPRLK